MAKFLAGRCLARHSGRAATATRLRPVRPVHGVWQDCEVVDRAEANQRPPTLEDGARRVPATTSASQGNVEGEGPPPLCRSTTQRWFATHYKHWLTTRRGQCRRACVDVPKSWTSTTRTSNPIAEATARMGGPPWRLYMLVVERQGRGMCVQVPSGEEDPNSTWSLSGVRLRVRGPHTRYMSLCAPLLVCSSV